MDTCITVWYWPNHERWYDEGIRHTLDLVRQAGFTHINWNPDAGSSYWLAEAEIEFTRRIIAASGLKVHSLHASNGRNPISEIGFKKPGRHTWETRKDLVSGYAWQRQSGIELVKNRIDLAAALQSPNIVLHIDLSEQVFHNQETENAFLTSLFASLDELQPYCREYGVRIAIENLCGAGSQAFLTLFERVFARYGPEFLGLCFDSGHWEIMEPGGLSVLERFGDRLIATHLHDNLGRQDDHLLPFDGCLDWVSITGAIAHTNYLLPVNFETPKDVYRIPEGIFYQRAHAVALRIESMIAAARA